MHALFLDPLSQQVGHGRQRVQAIVMHITPITAIACRLRMVSDPRAHAFLAATRISRWRQRPTNPRDETTRGLVLNEAWQLAKRMRAHLRQTSLAAMTHPQVGDDVESFLRQPALAVARPTSSSAGYSPSPRPHTARPTAQSQLPVDTTRAFPTRGLLREGRQAGRQAARSMTKARLGHQGDRLTRSHRTKVHHRSCERHAGSRRVASWHGQLSFQAATGL